MYTLVIAEDEFFIRKALLSQMDWAKLGCTILGETDNGDDAIALLQTLRPDILISDIQLIGKTGLEVCEYIYKQKLPVKTILITGYGELDYAKAAVKWNATDFILKPVNPAELEEAVRKAVALIETESQRNEQMANLKRMVQESLPLLKDKFLQQLANDQAIDPNELEQNMAFFHIGLSQYTVLALEIDDYDSFLNTYRPIERQALEMAIKEICLEQANDFEAAHYLDFAPNSRLLILHQKEEQKDITELAEAIQDIIFEAYGISVSAGISRARKQLARLSEAVEEARSALRHKFYSGNRAVIPYVDVQDVSRTKAISLFPHYVSATKAVLVGNTEDARSQFRRMLKLIPPDSDETYIKHTIIEFIVVLQTAIRSESIHLEEEAFEPVAYEMVGKQSTIGDVYRVAENLLISLAERVLKKISTRNRSVVDKLLSHIHENYHRDITLKELGEVAFMNPKYVCRLLKQETGENFTTMLTHIRIQKAKEIMEASEYRVYEIAEMVGIHDSRYFSQMFKKHTGVTPIEYRNKFTVTEEVTPTNKK